MKVKRRDTYVCISVNMYCYRGVGVCHIAWSFFGGGGGRGGEGLACCVRLEHIHAHIHGSDHLLLASHSSQTLL